MSDVFDKLNLDTVLEGVVDDHSEVVEFHSKDPMPEGWAIGRLVEYIEVGEHPQTYQGKEKAPEMVVWFGFMVTPARWDSQEERPVDTMYVRVTKKKNDKAAFTKLFMAMRGGRQDIKHSVDFIKRQDTFFMNIVHRESKAVKGKIYANIDKSTIERAVDKLTGNNHPMPARAEGYNPNIRVFLWDNPRKDMWDSLYIDGDYEREVDGAKVKVSKNFIQEECVKAVNFKGSPLNHLLLATYGSAMSTPEAVGAEQVAQTNTEAPTQTPAGGTSMPPTQVQQQAPMDTPQMQPAATQPPTENTQAAPKANESPADVLASLGVKL